MAKKHWELTTTPPVVQTYSKNLAKYLAASWEVAKILVEKFALIIASLSILDALNQEYTVLETCSFLVELLSPLETVA